MGRDVNDAPDSSERRPEALPATTRHSFFAATPRGGSMDALKMSTALR